MNGSGGDHRRVVRGAGRVRGPGGNWLPPGPGGPFGNMHAVKHPWTVFWRRRALRRQDRWILRPLEDYRRELVSDQGGEDRITAAAKRLIEQSALARGCQMLALAAAAERDGGLTGPLTSMTKAIDAATRATKTQPDLLAVVARFAAIEVSCLKVLGLERKVREVSWQERLLLTTVPQDTTGGNGQSDPSPMPTGDQP